MVRWRTKFLVGWLTSNGNSANIYTTDRLQNLAMPATGRRTYGPSFFVNGVLTMTKKTSKPFLSIGQQIEKLTQDKKLIISDRKNAEDVLSRIRYYALIDGYKNLFYNPMTRRYKEGARLEDILALYYFDEALRNLHFKYICHVEQRMRSLVSYYFCETYSHMQAEYLNPQNYNYARKNQKTVDRLTNSVLTYEANVNNNHAYVVYHRNTYGNVPLWVLMNTLTFGQLSKMYTVLKTGTQSKISRQFEAVSEKELGQFLKSMTNFRNVCAHNERLFSFRNSTDIPNKHLHEALAIQRKGDTYTQGKRDLFALVITLRYLLPREEFLEYKKELIRLIEQVKKESAFLTDEMLMYEMGFPPCWKHIARYKL